MAAVLVVLARSGDPERATTPAATVPAPSETLPAPAPAKPEPRSGGELAIGLGENNANLLWTEAARPTSADPALDPWRDRVEALQPAYYRLPIDWSALQPDPGGSPDFEQPADGCSRGAPPCGSYDGIRERLRAVRSQQDAHGGWQVIVVLYGVPDWAARPAQGCERGDILPRSRPITERGLEGYRALIRDLLAVAREERVELAWWSPWNEPNGLYFLSPQRAACETTSPPLAPGVYTRLVDAARAELDAAGGRHRILLGELAGNAGPSPRAAGIGEFVDALPDRIACRADAWSQHHYADPGAAGLEGPVGQLRNALDRRPCTRGDTIWVTETGAGNARTGGTRDTSRAALRADCRAMARLLRRWHRDARVDVALQYTFRDDALFPVGLADSRLTRAYPTYALWRAWGGRRPPDGPAPDRCRG